MTILFPAGIYLTVTMAMTSLSIVLTVFVLQLHHVGPNQKPAPAWIKNSVIKVIAPLLCMKSYVDNHYNNTSAAKASDDMTMTSFSDYVDYNNCNGKASYPPHHQSHLHPLLSHSPSTRRHRPPRADYLSDDQFSYDQISNHLKILVSKHDGEDEFQDIINEWRLIAHIMDRFLFWIFLVGSFLSSLVILVLLPMTKPSVIGV